MINKKSLYQAITVFGLMTLALLTISSIPTAFGSLISAQDNPSEIAGATGGTGSIRELVLKIVNYALGFLGLVAVIMVIYGGFLYVTAGGEQENVDKGKKILMYSMIGIILILLSFAIVNTVLGVASGGAASAGGGTLQ